MRLVLLHPEIVGRSCADCKAWMFDDSPTRLSGRKFVRAGQPQPRPPNLPTPCHQCPKIPAGADPKPENAVELSPKNWRAYSHYLECRAVLKFPDADPIVRRNAVLIRMVEDEARDAREDRRADLTTSLLLANRFARN